MNQPFDSENGRHGIVYFGNDWAAENRTSSHHIAMRLAQRAPLLYVDSPGMRAPTASARDFRKIARKLRQTMELPVAVGEHMWRCTVPQLPFRRIPGVGRLNVAYATWALRRAIKSVGFDRYLLWFALPHPGFLAGRLQEDFVVYYCIDDYAAHPGVDVELIARADASLSVAADRLFVAPPALLEAKKKLNDNAVFSPHGVDAELFGRANLPETKIPEVAAGLRKPIVGFFGSMADWIDTSLLAKLARERPGYTLLIVGFVSTNVEELKALPNVHFVGPQKYETLPNWAKSFDVAVIPYRLNRQVFNANPLKLREYLATGRPVVSVQTPEVDRFSEFVKIAGSPDEFVRAVDDALRDDNEAARVGRMSSVRSMTWDARVDEAWALVASDIKKGIP